MIVRLESPFTVKIKGDTYVYEDEGLLKRPSDDFVMSRDIHGSPLSLYGQNKFDYSAYSRNNTKIMNFETDVPLNYTEQAKWLHFLVERFGRGRNKNNLSSSTLYAFLQQCIKPLCRFAASRNETPALDVLNDKNLLTLFVQENLANNIFCRNVISFINHLKKMPPKQLGITIELTKRLEQRVKTAVKASQSDKKQTKLIPPRLYINCYFSYLDLIEEFEKISVPFLKILEAWGEPTVTKSEFHKIAAPLLQQTDFKAFVGKYKLLTTKGQIHTSSMKHFVTQFQQVCVMAIEFFTGMRIGEARNLPYHCASLEKAKNKSKALRIIGYTFKYTGNMLRGDWVTSEEGHRAVRALQKIAAVISNNTNISTQKKLSEGELPCPLLISISYLAEDKRYRSESGEVMKNEATLTSKELTILDHKLLTINEEDVLFLEEFEPERSWRSEGVLPGSQWNTSNHQFRRSLAVYSRQSGLVSIGSVQTQLHHLFDATSYYYANNFENCPFDITNKDHMGHEFKKRAAEADFAAYVRDILFSNTPLAGVEGLHVEKNIKPTLNNKEEWILNNKAQTIQKMKQGSIAYTETPLGGCGSSLPCQDKLTRNWTACYGCEKSSLTKEKCESMIKFQSNLVNSLNPNSVEYRFEKSELEMHIKEYEKRFGKREVA